MMKKLFLLSFLILSACRLYTMQDYKNEMMGKYYNADMEKVVMDYGIPTNSYTLDKMVLVEYDHQDSKYIPKTVRKDTERDKQETHTNVHEYGGYTVDLICKTTFFFRDGKVFDLKFEGNDCFQARYVFN